MDQSAFEKLLLELDSHHGEIRPSDIGEFSNDLRAWLNFVLRLGSFSLKDLYTHLGLKIEQAQALADRLVLRNFIRLDETSSAENPRYETRFSSHTRPLGKPSTDLWKKIE
ncbi:MAG: hypothetical protein WHS87_08155 [Anaerolineales bacterium]